MTKNVQSPSDNLRVTTVPWDQLIMDCLGGGRFHRLKGFLKGFITICDRVQFGKSSVLVKYLIELNWNGPYFQELITFWGKEITLGPYCISEDKRKRQVWVKEMGKGGRKFPVVGTVTYSFDLQKVGWSCAVVCQMTLALSELKAPVFKTRGSKFGTFH